MKTLEQGEERVQKLCDALRRETLEPAQVEARELVEKAQRQAHEIVERARAEAAAVEQAAREKIEQERAVFNTSLEQASKQAMEVVRQSIEKELLRDQLYQEIVASTSNEKVVSKLVEVILKSLDQSGIESDLSAVIASSCDAEAVNHHLGQKMVDRLKEGGVVIGGFEGGVRVVLHDEQITLDITAEALLELLGRFLRRDFREMLFRVAG